MRIHRKLIGALVASFAALAAHGVAAQEFPTKPVRLIVAFPPGGVADIMARDYAHELSSRLGQTVVVENKPGAGTTIGADFVAKSAPDGHTLYLTNIGQSISAAFYKKLPDDVDTDFSPVAILADVPSVLAAPVDFPANNVAELIELAKKEPGTINFASAGNGTGSHMFGEYLKSLAEIDIVHVPYKGTAPAFTDLITGRVSLIFEPIGTMLPHLASGKTKALGVSTSERVNAAPDIPAIAESGLPDFDVSTWYGVLAPAGTPKAVIEKLNGEFVAVTNEPKMQERLRSQGAVPVGNTPEEFQAVITRDIERWKGVMEASGIEPM